MHDREKFEHVKRCIDIIGRGGMIIMVDDEDRENEGDLVVAAQHCDAKAVNFMARHGRGLICLALDPARVEALGLPMMVPRGPRDMGTAFTVSIEARTGVTTGISAADRAETIRVATDPRCTAADITSPGHIFPLRAQAGGVLVRSGHTEGSVDIARLAGCQSAGVICEIMRDDGEMARMDDLEVFAREHGLEILTIADLIEYRLQNEMLVEEMGRAPMVSPMLQVREGWTVRSFRSLVEPSAHFLAFTKGELRTDEPVLLRAQRAQLLGDVFGHQGDDSAARIRSAFTQIEAAGRGAFLYVLPPGYPGLATMSLSSEPSARDAESGFRDFGLGAQVLKCLGISRIKVMTNNERKIVGLEGFGIEVVGTTPLDGDSR